jgi:hypothetical protein
MNKLRRCLSCDPYALPMIALTSCVTLLVLVVLTSCGPTDKPSAESIGPSIAPDSAFVQTIDDPFFVDVSIVIKAKNMYDIKGAPAFDKLNTQADLWTWKEYIYAEVRKKDPTFKGK